LEDLAKLSGYFATLREKYQSLLDPIAQRPDIGVFLHQVPGGMLSNLLSQLKEQKRADLYPAVLDEIPRVRKDLGYPPLVTPTSQIVGTQAVLNVILGKRYAQVSKEVKEYCLGIASLAPSIQIRKKIIGKESRLRKTASAQPQLEALKKANK
jgi:pyruvate carboxylase subunit B